MLRLEYQVGDAPIVGFEIEPGKSYVLGRSKEANWRVDGEPAMSRLQAELKLEGGRLRVKALPGAKNPIFRDGKPAGDFALEPGHHFVIGKTKFRFLSESLESISPTEEGTATAGCTLSAEELHAGMSPDRTRLLDLLKLPDILRLKNQKEIYFQIAEALRHGTGAHWACAADEKGKVLAESAVKAKGPRAKLSGAILAKAVADSPRPTIYQWDQANFGATVPEGESWAICAASCVAGEAPLFFYAGGVGHPKEADSRDSARFVGLVADMVTRTRASGNL